MASTVNVIGQLPVVVRQVSSSDSHTLRQNTECKRQECPHVAVRIHDEVARFLHVEMPSPAVPSTGMSTLEFGDGVHDGHLFQTSSVILLSDPLRNDFHIQLTVENGGEVEWLRTDVVTFPSVSDPIQRQGFWVMRPRSKPIKVLRSIT